MRSLDLVGTITSRTCCVSHSNFEKKWEIALSDVCVFGTPRQRASQNGAAGWPPTVSLYTSTTYTPHRKRHGLPRHHIAATISHPTIFNVNPLFKV
ncbi:hypothetical protein V8E53_001585 [Lactarius tabidus]